MSEANKACVRHLVEEVWSQGKLEVLDVIIHPDAKAPHGPWAKNDIPGLMSRLAAATVRRYIDEALNKGNASIVDEVFAPDAVSHTPNGDLRGHDEIKEPILMRRGAFPDLQVTIDKQVADGDNVVTYLTLRGTHKGDYRGVPATDRQVTWTQIAIARFDNGKIVESWRIPDRLGLRQQMGSS